MKFKFLKKEKIKKLPKKPGVYAFRASREILYIGKASNIRDRVKNHFLQPDFKESIFLDKTQKIGYVTTHSEIEALILEANLIKKYQPKYNVIWKDDKNYFFIAITKEDFPRVFWTHQPKLKAKSYKLKADFVGPFVDGKAVKQTLKILRKIFPYRSCKNLPKRPCLWYHLGRCLAPCLIKTPKDPLLSSERRGPTGQAKLASQILGFKEKLKKECQKNAQNVFQIFQGKKTQVLKNLKKEMKEASRLQEFERAAEIRNQIEAFEKILAHSKIFEISKNLLIQPWQINKYEWKKVKRVLKKILKTKKEISRIEAYDVSNIQGQQATGSMITFIDGLPDKNFYRRFKIKFTKKPNDIAMLKEVLSRRFKHPEWPYPDLILIDGGRAQLNAAIECSKCHFEQIALAKKKNELYIEGQEWPILLKNLPREIFNLILQLRDEAHRFAFIYHKKLREKELFVG